MGQFLAKVSGFMSTAWFYVVIAGAVVLAFLLTLTGARRQGERVGKVTEQLRSKHVAEKAREKMDSVPRPDKPDVVRKLRDGKF